MQVRPAGDRAVLVELGEVSAAELHAAARTFSGLVVVGHQSLLHFPDIAPAQTTDPRPQTHDIPVAFDRDPREVTLAARFLGFRAGFAYLDGWPDPMPRLPTSRPVARGSFAVAGSMAGFYPIDTPGGWNIVGRTNAVLWDPNREPPNLIAAGDVVHVFPVDDLPPMPPVAPPRMHGEVIAEVLSPGQLTRIVGAKDWSRLVHGLAEGGPFDEIAAAIANRAAGNGDDAGLLECVLVGPKLRFVRPTRVGLSDGSSQVVDEIDLGRLRTLRAYVAIEGGLEVPKYAEEAVRVTRGMQLHVMASVAEPSGRVEARRTNPKEIAIMPGPHEPSIREIECEVTPQLDRVGIRLRPLRDLGIDAPKDLRSCGMQCGSVQLHPDGSLVVMGPDHPVTGGYLQPMTVLSSEIWKLAQLMPGERVRFYSP